MNPENINLDFTDPTNALSPEESNGLNTESADVVAEKMSEKLAAGETLSAEDKALLGEKIKILTTHQSYVPSGSTEALELSGKIALMTRIMNGETLH